MEHGLCFNRGFYPRPAEEELSFRELQESLRMPKEDLQRVLHSLSCAKYKVSISPHQQRALHNGAIDLLLTQCCRHERGSWLHAWAASELCVVSNQAVP
jgi:hypothetical protein